MNNQPSLLTPTTPAVSYPRAAQIERAYAKANPLIMALYEKAVRIGGSILPDFTACEITEIFTAKCGKPDTVTIKALGGLYIRLQKEGVIEKTGGYRARNQGNAAAVYRLRK